MKVVHLSESDGAGGAAVAALRLHSAVRRLGMDSWMLVGQKLSDDERVARVGSPLAKKIQERLDRLPVRLLRTSNESHLSPAWIGGPVRAAANRHAPSVFHLHWICKGFFRIEDLRRLRAPVAWSLHDMWPFAGGEHYVGDCTRYRDGYLKNNRPAFESGFDLNRWIWKRKRRAWAAAAVRDLTLFPVSHWLADRARASVLFRDRPVEVVHNALDEKIFRPHDHAAARRALGLPLDKPLLLFGALRATGDKRKGFDLLTSALDRLRGHGLELELVVFGNAPDAVPPATEQGFKAHYLGEISDPRQLAQLYGACDAMVVPSREEAFGQTAMEALACGTPVIAFRVGGVPEVVEHDRSGYLAEPFDIDDLARGIHRIVSAAGAPRWKALAEAGRAKVENEFTFEVQARRCRQLYERMIERAAQRGAS